MSAGPENQKDTFHKKQIRFRKNRVRTPKSAQRYVKNNKKNFQTYEAKQQTTNSDIEEAKDRYFLP